jgi:hypothetical protein
VVAQLQQTIALDFHGVRVNVVSDDAECAASIETDFSRFIMHGNNAASAPVISIFASLSAPPAACIPANRRPWMKTRDAAVYAWRGKRVLDSHGKALVALQFTPDQAQIYSLDRSLIREKVYLVIMSRVGEWLDRRGLHRIHAMGVSRDGRAVICALAEGGGKTTLTLGLMNHPGFSLLSDEVPLVSRQGRLLGLPVRLGVREDAELSIPARFLSRFRRSRHAPKILIDAGYFADKVVTEAAPGILLIGCRIDAEQPSITPASFPQAFAVLWQLCVRGHGVPQLLEYVLRIRPGALLSHMVILASRTLACAALVRRSECYKLGLGRDREANAQLVAQLAAGTHSGRERARCDLSP